MFARTQGLYKG